MSDRLTLAGGLVYPAAQPSGRWGLPGGVIRGDDGTLRPAPTRYQLLVSGNRAFFPTLGAALQLWDFLLVGASFSWGIFAIDTTTMSTAGGGTDPQNQVISRVQAEDYFVPVVTTSIHFVPVDALDISLGARVHDGIDASGKMWATTGAYSSDFQTHTGPPLEITSLRQNMPWALLAGVRYAQRRAPRVYDAVPPGSRAPASDAMTQEYWDLEMDLEYQLSGLNDEQVIEYAPGEIEFVPVASGEVVGSTFPPPGIDAVRIPKRWQDQWSFQLGGTVNAVPGLFSISAGAHYETRGVDPSFAQIDFWPLTRLGLHAGVTLRFFGRHDLVIAYAHIFQETLHVGPPEHGSRLSGGFDKTVDALDTRGQVLEPVEAVGVPSETDATAKRAQVVTQTSAGDPAYVINAGRFRSSYDVLSVTLHLRL